MVMVYVGIGSKLRQIGKEERYFSKQDLSEGAKDGTSVKVHGGGKIKLDPNNVERLRRTERSEHWVSIARPLSAGERRFLEKNSCANCR